MTGFPQQLKLTGQSRYRSPISGNFLDYRAESLIIEASERPINPISCACPEIDRMHGSSAAGRPSHQAKSFLAQSFWPTPSGSCSPGWGVRLLRGHQGGVEPVTTFPRGMGKMSRPT